MNNMIDKKGIAERIKSLSKYNADIEKQLLSWKDRIKNDKSDTFVKLQKKNVLEQIKKYTSLLKANKKYLLELKKTK